MGKGIDVVGDFRIPEDQTEKHKKKQKMKNKRPLAAQQGKDARVKLRT